MLLRETRKDKVLQRETRKNGVLQNENIIEIYKKGKDIDQFKNGREHYNKFHQNPKEHWTLLIVDEHHNEVANDCLAHS